MRILVTTGNTQMLIDKVRCITNIFTGRTGTKIAIEAKERRHELPPGEALKVLKLDE